MYKLSRTDDGTWLVPSQSTTDRIYRVNLEKEKAVPAWIWIARTAGLPASTITPLRLSTSAKVLPDGTMIETQSVTLATKTVYKQDWPAYDRAQSTEKHRLGFDTIDA